MACCVKPFFFFPPITAKFLVYGVQNGRKRNDPWDVWDMLLCLSVCCLSVCMLLLGVYDGS